MQHANLILISYKNKILLSTTDSLMEENVWGFIGDEKFRFKTQSDTIQFIRKTMNPGPISVNKEILSKNKSIFQIKLSDKNVNSIERLRGFRLEFYSIEEMENLKLTNGTKAFIENFRVEIIQLIGD